LPEKKNTTALLAQRQQRRKALQRRYLGWKRCAVFWPGRDLKHQTNIAATFIKTANVNEDLSQLILLSYLN
jgi:hypothetical protein